SMLRLRPGLPRDRPPCPHPTPSTPGDGSGSSGGGERGGPIPAESGRPGALVPRGCPCHGTRRSGVPLPDRCLSPSTSPQARHPNRPAARRVTTRRNGRPEPGTTAAGRRLAPGPPRATASVRIGADREDQMRDRTQSPADRPTVEVGSGDEFGFPPESIPEIILRIRRLTSTRLQVVTSAVHPETRPPSEEPDMTTNPSFPPLGLVPSLPSEPAIVTKGLVKHFGETRAVDGVALQVPAGMIYGVLGPNGAGKTTVIRMLATLLQPDGGTARIFGHDIVSEADAVRSRVSMTGQFASVDE